jgi:CheY-like chemotaxis protein
MRLLIVDDNATNRDILHEQLASWGIDHRAVADGNEALAALRDAAAAGTPFGLAILDMQMPGINGRELAKAIKRDDRIKDTILILLSSSQEELDPKQLQSCRKLVNCLLSRNAWEKLSGCQRCFRGDGKNQIELASGA